LTCGGTETNVAYLYVAVPQVTLAISPTTFALGQPVTVTATVTGNSGTPTGNLSLNLTGASNVSYSLPLNSKGTASVTTNVTGIPAGEYTVTATYPGSARYASAASTPIKLDILAIRNGTLTFFNATPTTVSPGQTVTLTASLEGTAVAGNVAFFAEGQPIGTATLSQLGGANHTATLALVVPQVPGGNYLLIATYEGNDEFAPSSNTATVTVTGPLANTLTLTASPNPVTPPASLTLTATQAQASGKPVPTGSVDFYLGSTFLGASSLNGSGTATFTYSTSGLAAGTDSFTANYAGDANYTNTTASTTVTVN